MYKVFWVPFMNRRKYRQFDNVFIDDTTHDQEFEIGSLTSKSPRDQEIDEKSYDIKLMHVGRDYIDSLPGYKYMLFDIRNINLHIFEGMIQDKIDRFEPKTHPIGMMAPKTLPMCMTRSDVMRKRSRVIKTFGIDGITEKAFLIIHILKYKIEKNWLDSDEWEDYISRVIFIILANIFLGEGFEDLTVKAPIPRFSDSKYSEKVKS
jgi:hypothetical protein